MLTIDCCWLDQGIPAWCTERDLASQFCPTEGFKTGSDSLSPHVPTFTEFILPCFFFYWSIIALQCFVSFCCATVICIHISPPSSASLPSILTPVLPVITELWAELPVPYSSFPLAVCFTRGSVYMSFVLYRISILDMGSQLVWELLYCTEEAEQGEAVQYSG